MKRSSRLRRLWGRIASRRATVALLSALLIPAMTGATGLGVEISYWSVRHLELQQIADQAALAASAAYNAGASIEAAANAGADVAELNGLSGAASRSWDAAASTLADNTITVKQVAGIRSSGDIAFQAVVTQTIPLIVAKRVTSYNAATISASSSSELISANVNGCLLILGTSSSSLSMDNGAKVDETGCATRTNGSIVVKGGAKLNAGGVAAAGTISLSNGGQINSPQRTNAGTFPDPYATDTATQNAIAAAKAASGSALSVGNGKSQTISPGSYSSLTLNNGAKVTMNPGLYLINGKVDIAGGATLSGTGVTIVATGQVSISNGTEVTLSAPTASATAGVPGMAFIGSSTEDWALNGGSKFVVTGVMYYPNGHVEADNGFGSSSATCSVMIANTLTINGGAKLANNCTSDSGVKNLPVPVGTPTVMLVK